MQSLWSGADAERMVERYAAEGVGRDLALHVYTSRLLGREPKLVLHGGGNTSQTAAAAVDPPQALWKTRVLTSMLSRGSTLAGAVGSSKAECAVKRAVPSSAES